MPPISTSSVAIAVTPSVILVVHARATSDGARVIGHGAVETPPSAVRGAVVEQPATVAHAIRGLWRQMGLRERSAAAVLPPAGDSMRALRFPDLPAREQRQVVRGELEQTGALPFGAGGFDFIWLREPAEAGGAAQATAYACFSTDGVIDSLRETLRLAGLQMATIEPGALASMRAYLAYGSERPPLALLCPADKHTDLAIHDGNGIRLLRRIPAGISDLGLGVPGGHAASSSSVPGDHRTERGAYFLGGSEEVEIGAIPEAPDLEAAPAVWGEDEEVVAAAAPATAPAPRATAARPPAPPVTPAAEESSFLVTEVGRSLAFYAREHEDSGRPRCLVILGTPAVTERFERLLAGTQSIPVTVAPVADTMLGPGEAPRDLAGAVRLLALPAVGAAIGAVGRELGIPQLNVAHQEQRGRTVRARPEVLVAGLLGSGVLLLGSVVLAGAFSFLAGVAADERTRLSTELVQLQRERAPLVAYGKGAESAHALQQKSEVPAGPVLGRVAAAANPGVTLATIQLAPDGRLKIDGSAADSTSFQRFAYDLATGSTLRSPAITSTKATTGPGLAFQIEATTGRAGAPAGGK